MNVLLVEPICVVKLFNRNLHFIVCVLILYYELLSLFDCVSETVSDLNIHSCFYFSNLASLLLSIERWYT